MQSANVRALARFAANASCPTAVLGFAARVDFDTLLAGTRFEPAFGQSPFAFRRGNTFERRLRRNHHEPLLALLETHLGRPPAKARVADLRDGLPPSRARAEETERQLGMIVRGDAAAPNLIDGAVLFKRIGGVDSYFEADAIAASFDGPVHAGEVKSFPTVDGQADPEKLGAAVAQVSIYILLLREMVERLGGDPSRVSTEALIITPRNTGLQPTMTVKDVGREIDRARRILDSVPSARDVVDSVPAKVGSFGDAAEGDGKTENQRVDAAVRILETVGTKFQPSCLATCGLSKLCRERAASCGALTRLDRALSRALPGVETIDRVRELAGGAKPSPAEQVAAEKLVETRTLLDAWARPVARKGKRSP
jgi:hypothetical protein